MQNKYDVIILGAGAAGLMCAWIAGSRGKHVLLLDHSNKPADIYYYGGIFIYTESNELVVTKIGASFIRHLVLSSW